MNRTTDVRGGARVDVCASERASGVELFLTARPADRSGADAASVLEEAAKAVAARGAAPIAEKLYGPRAHREDTLALRDSIYRRRGLDPSVPVTWIEGLPLAGEALVGLQIWAVDARVGEVRTVDAVVGRGRLWDAGGFRLLYVPSITGPGGEDAPGEAKRMFARAGQALESQGMSFRDVARTWIYLSRLLDWYGDLNAVRTAFYGPAGLGEGGVAFPASTGIQGRSGDEECLMDVLAVVASPASRVEVTPIHRSPRQDQSFRYGSAFSRGMVIALDGVRTVHISGTASIDTSGASTHLDDPEMQSVETLLSISAILEEQGGSLADIVSATLYCKDERSFEAWERVTHLLRVPAFPRVTVKADVCRADLLVEMECVAVLGPREDAR